MLAPVAAEIDRNLQRMRDRTSREVEYELELALDCDGMIGERGQRAQLVADLAVRGVDMHGWTASITDDGCRLHLDGGSVSLDLGLSEGITAYIREGVKA